MVFPPPQFVFGKHESLPLLIPFCPIVNRLAAIKKIAVFWRKVSRVEQKICDLS